MRRAEVYINREKSGILSQGDNGSFSFHYLDEWLTNPHTPAVSLTLPKTPIGYTSDFLFPYFFHLLPEGTNKELICRKVRIDPDDHFGLLLHVASSDTVGKVTVVEIPVL